MSGAADNFLHQVKQAAQQQHQDYGPFVYGHIANYDPKTNRVRLIMPSVRDEDGNCALTPWMQLGSAWASNGFGMQVAPVGGATPQNPTAGEQCLIGRIDRQQGFGAVLLMGFNQVNVPPFPDLKPGECGIKAQGGSFVRFNADKSLTLDTSEGNAPITINAGTGTVDVTALKTTIHGDCEMTANLNVLGSITWPHGSIGGAGDQVVIDGTLTATQDVMAGEGGADQVSLKTHTHGSVQPGSGHTGAPDAGT